MRNEVPKTVTGWVGLAGGMFAGLVGGAIHGTITAISGEGFEKGFRETGDKCVYAGMDLGDANHENAKAIAIGTASRIAGNAITDNLKHNHQNNNKNS